MTHFHNKDIRKAVIEHNPTSKELVESLEFGEITEGEAIYSYQRKSVKTDKCFQNREKY